ncbi:MAG: MbnP family protein, partial [Flavobacteriales bacterium]
GTDSIRLDQFKFYVGNQHGDYQLVDASDTNTLTLFFKDTLLYIGMDSLSNTLGKLEGPFDPLLGMYWAWNTGYIQLKVVGNYVTAQTSIPY